MKNRIPFVLLLVFSIVFTLSFYGSVIFHPNDYLFNNSGDAIKNYFTYCFHIKVDNSYINFTGMNYPYGEHFLYTDCHPALANFLKLLSSKFNFFSTYSIGILNFIMLLSIFLTFIICYFLLREFKLNRWFSLLFSIGITLLAPQIFRLGGHFALSYSIAIPLAWLLLIKTFKDINKPVYPILLFVNNLFWLFIHAYLGMIIVFFLVCFVVCKYISNKNRWKEILHYVRVISLILAPVILFLIFIKITDTHIGRTDNPSGFFLYNAELDDVFLPSHPPLRPLFDGLTGNIIKQQWEASSYVGFSTTILFIVLIVLSIIKLFKRKSTTIIQSFFQSETLNISLISAFIVLIFAMAIPFRQIPGLIDLVPFVKQFRATGRFAWPFYFVATVFAATMMQEIYSRQLKNRSKIIVLSLCIAVGLFNIVEGIPYHIETSNNIVQSKNLFKKESLSNSYTAALNAIDSKKFQAIIALPFYYQGSESYSRPRNDETMRASMVLAYHTGIPIVCANLTRTSIKESKNIVQLVSPDFYTKEIQNDLPDNKPFIVIRTKDNITNYEQDILSKCKPIYLSDEISIYSLDRIDLFRNNAQTIYAKYKQLEPKLFRKEQFYVTKDSSFLYYSSFEDLKSDKPYRGKGGFQSVKRGKNTFVEFAPNTFSTGKKYHVSIWMNNSRQDALNDWFRFIVEEYNEESNTWETTTYFPEQSEVINGDWSLIEGTFAVKNPKNKISIVTKGKDDSKGPLFVDDILVKEEGVDIYSLSDYKDKLFFNNHDVLLK